MSAHWRRESGPILWCTTRIHSTTSPTARVSPPCTSLGTKWLRPAEDLNPVPAHIRSSASAQHPSDQRRCPVSGTLTLGVMLRPYENSGRLSVAIFHCLVRKLPYPSGAKGGIRVAIRWKDSGEMAFDQAESGRWPLASTQRYHDLGEGRKLAGH